MGERGGIAAIPTGREEMKKKKKNGKNEKN